MPRPNKNPNISVIRATGKPPLLNRQACSGCSKLRPVATVNGEHAIADHLVFVRDETHPAGGTHELCPGAGKPGDGMIIHSAVTEWRRA